MNDNFINIISFVVIVLWIYDFYALYVINKMLNDYTGDKTEEVINNYNMLSNEKDKRLFYCKLKTKYQVMIGTVSIVSALFCSNAIYIINLISEISTDNWVPLVLWPAIPIYFRIVFYEVKKNIYEYIAYNFISYDYK